MHSLSRRGSCFVDAHHRKERVSSMALLPRNSSSKRRYLLPELLHVLSHSSFLISYTLQNWCVQYARIESQSCWGFVYAGAQNRDHWMVTIRRKVFKNSAYESQIKWWKKDSSKKPSLFYYNRWVGETFLLPFSRCLVCQQKKKPQRRRAVLCDYGFK